MSRNNFFSTTGTILVILFILFSILVHFNLFHQIDLNTTKLLQHDISRKFDFPFSILSSVGQFEFMAVILICIFLFLRKIMSGIIAFVFFLIYLFVEVFGKYFVHHPPPPEILVRTQNIFQFPEPYVQNLNSYPSGHAGRTMFISVLCYILIWQSKKLPFYTKFLLIALICIFDITMLLSRIYLGEHWLSDVIGGTILGSALGFFAAIFITDSTRVNKLSKNKKNVFQKFKFEVKKVE